MIDCSCDYDAPDEALVARLAAAKGYSPEAPKVGNSEGAGR